MNTVRTKGEAVRTFLIQNLLTHSGDIVRLTADKFSCSRQAVHAHLRRLISDGAVTESGQTRSKTYCLAPLLTWSKLYSLTSELAEDTVWRQDIAPHLGPLPKNVLSLWEYGFTEMFNNVIEHSGATGVRVKLEKTAAATIIIICDEGVGIFKKIRSALSLLDERHAVLELAKGKFTTDPSNHSGEGIFFSSRMFDSFSIVSGDVIFSHNFGKEEDWIHHSPDTHSGTTVLMRLDNHTARTTKKIFDQFTSGDDYGFTKTVVPVHLARYGDENLISRSQAKRLLLRVERFKQVVLDFSGIESIGQAFADEVFRVFRVAHPELELTAINACSEVKKMITRAEALRAQSGTQG